MKLWVTGAASFLGRELLACCRQSGIEVFGTDLAAADVPELTVLDVCSRRIAEAVPEGIDAVVHLAAVSSDAAARRDPVRCFEVNVAGTLNVLRAARERGIAQLVFASSEWVYDVADSPVPRREDDPIDAATLTSEYALSKQMAETVLRQAHRNDVAAGPAVTVLRFGILYGARPTGGSAVESLLAQVAAGGVVEVGSARTARGFVHVRDAARAILSALGRTGFEIFNIEPERPIELREVVERAGAVLGRAWRLIEKDPDHPSVRNISGERARRVLGWSPQISLDDGLREAARAAGHRLADADRAAREAGA